LAVKGLICIFYTGEIHISDDVKLISTFFEILELACMYINSNYASKIQYRISQLINNETFVDILYFAYKCKTCIKPDVIENITNDVKKYLYRYHDIMMREYIKLSDLASGNKDEEIQQELDTKAELMKEILRSYTKGYISVPAECNAYGIITISKESATKLGKLGSLFFPHYTAYNSNSIFFDFDIASKTHVIISKYPMLTMISLD
jgi:hypothetical protein